MSHSVIIIDGDGNSTEYFPSHDLPPENPPDGLVASIYNEENPPFLLCHFAKKKKVDRMKEKARAGTVEISNSEISKDIMDQVKEIFG